MLSLLRQAPILTICAQHHFPRLRDLEHSRCLGCQIPLGTFMHYMGKPTPFDHSIEGIYKVILFDETPVSIVMLPGKIDSAAAPYTSYVYYLANPATGLAC